MSKTDQYSRRIADYIYNDMAAAERKSFEEDLLKDAELAKEYKFQSTAVEILKAKIVLEDMRSSPDLEEAERIVDEYMAEQADENQSGNRDLDSGKPSSELDPSTRFPRRKGRIIRILYPVLAAAAVFAGLLIIRNITSDNLSERLFSKYYHPLEDVNFTGRGENNDMYSSFRDAINHYHDGDYLSATYVLSDLSSQNPGFPESYLYLGLSKIGEEEYAPAAVILEDYLLRFKKYELEAQWYLAMCYLKLDRSQEAVELISNLTNLGGSYGRDSRDIEKRLERVLE